MTELTIWQSAAGPVGHVWFDATEVKIDDRPYYKPTALAYRFDINSGTVEGQFALKDAHTIPIALFRGGRLRTWREIAQETTGAARKEIDDSIDSLRQLAFDSSGKFLGLAKIGGAHAEYRIELDLALAMSDSGRLTTQTLFTATAMAQFKNSFSSPFVKGGLDATLALAVAFRVDTKIHLTPRIDVHELPNLSITWPTMPANVTLGTNPLSFANFDLGKAALKQLLALPLPKSPVSVNWASEPEFEFKLVGDDLTIVTNSPGDGEIDIWNEHDHLYKAWLIFDGFRLKVENKAIELSVDSLRSVDQIRIPVIEPDSPFEVGPFSVRIDVGLSVSTTVTNNVVTRLEATVHCQRCEIRAIDDPSLVLAVFFELDINLQSGGTALKKLELIEPYPVNLALAAAHVIQDGVRRLWSLVQRINMQPAQAPELGAIIGALRRLAELVAVAIAWMARQGAAGARALAGLAESALKLLLEAIHRLIDELAAAGDGLFKQVTIELRFDAATWKLVQVVVTPRDPVISTKAFKATFLGFELEVPWELSPAVVADLEDDWIAFVLQMSGGKKAKLSTDLWFDTLTAPSEQVSSAEEKKHLLEVTATLTAQAPVLALVALNQGRAEFFRKLVTQKLDHPINSPTGEEVVAVGDLLLGTAVQKLEKIGAGDVTIEVTPPTKAQILSLFNIPDSAGPSFIQHIKVVSLKADVTSPPKIGLALECEVLFSDVSVTGPININLDLSTLSVSLKGGRFELEILTGELKSLFGLDARFVAKEGNPRRLKALYLDLSSGNPVLGLTDEARIDLAYKRLSADRRGLGFEVDVFKVGRDGVDLSGKIKQEPVTLSGVDMPFRFDQGELAIERSRIREFSLKGHGNLPPALVGEAKATIKLAFTQHDGALVVQACEAELDKSGDPLRCENTRMSLTITKLGLRFVEDGSNRDYHFYFTLTGAAQFKPNGDEFGGGLLKHLSKLKIVLNEVPLAADPRVLLNHIEFQVPVEPPDRTNFFDIFSFELRGVGFHPAASAFDGDPALSISGQVSFTKAFDTVSPRFDFHKMWVAAPRQGSFLPRVRFDGLGVGLQLGPSVHVEGTGVAVDGNLDSLYPSPLPAANLTGKGFLAAGSLRIDGWASMSANMGFLELDDSKKRNPEKRHAFYLYIQQDDLAEPIPTPIGNIYLREIGFGFGHRYTLAGLAAADEASTPQQLVSLLDDVSKIQGNLHTFESWRPQYDSDELTLALRGLLSLTTASPRNTPYNEAKERNLANPVLFDIVAALRSDLTFLMNIRAWIAYNYNDWREARKAGGSPWQKNPPLRGYMYLSARKHIFLARSISDGSGAIGEHPKLPPQLIDAMKSFRWSSTVYVTPSIFHMEFGWPYELRFDLGNESDRFFVSASGGLVLRYEDSAMLHGLAFRARGHAKLEGDTGGDVGASVSAIARFDLGAKMISHISARFNDSMLYGELTLDVTVSFSVRAWLRTRWFSLSAGFSVSLTIHIALELVVSPSGVGGRVEASVGVSVFGRRLSVGVSFTFGNQALAEARNRVARFLQLGLGTTYPDPTKGVAVDSPALPEPRRQDNAERADRAVEEAAGRREELSPPGSPPAPDPTAIWDEPGKIVYSGNVNYWAILVPIPGTAGTKFIVQVVPKGSETHIDSANLAGRSFFYAPPLDADAKVGEPAPDPSQGYQVSGYEGLKHLGLGRNPGWVHWAKRTGHPGEPAPPTLGQFMRVGCFMASSNTEPDPIHWTTDPAAMPEDPEAFDRACADAARSRAELSLFGKRCQQVEEARSAFVATVGQAVAELAQLASADGSIDETAAAGLEFDPRSLGLTFAFIKDTDESGHKIDVKDIVHRIVVEGRKLDGTYGGTGGPNVRCFNPPARMFFKSPPSLVDPRIVVSDGLQLHWDLEPAWPASASVEDDPEFHLKHYRIERTVQIEGLTDQPQPRAIVAKGADQILMSGHQSGSHRSARLQWTRMQVVDDLSDLPDNVRKLIVPTPSTAKADTPPPSESKVAINYRIVPVDIAGTEGLITQLSFAFDSGQQVQPTVGNPNLAFDFGPELPADLNAPVATRLSLEHETRALTYILRARSETRQLGSTFGDDALEDALNAPLAPERKDNVPRANEIDIEIKQTEKKPPPNCQLFPLDHFHNGKPLPQPDPENPLIYYISNADGARLRAHLGISELKQVATRFYVRPAAIGTETKFHPAWMPVRVQIQAGEPDKKDPSKDDPHTNLRPVDITLERFEYPLTTRFAALGINDMPPIESGRLHLLYPKAESAFCDFADDSKMELVDALTDAERRTGLRLTWNAFPSTLETLKSLGGKKPGERQLRALTGGFDLFALDAASVPMSVAATREVFDYVKPLGRVHRLTRAEGNQWPAETGDFANVQYLYPSEQRRLKEARQGEKRAPWFSPAESFLRWPDDASRRSLITSIDETELSKLFAHGKPDMLTIGVVLPEDLITQPWAILTDKECYSAEMWILDGLVLRRSGDHRATVDDVRRALLSLYFKNGLPPSSDAGAAIVITVEARIEGKKAVTGTAQFVFEPKAAQHAVLADVLDLVRYANLYEDSNELVYRRYEVLIEPVPAISAQTMQGFLDETPAERDPAGWGILRTLGLATSFRLYDSEAGEFCEPSQARKQLSHVLKAVHDRYRKQVPVYLGTPFADVLGTLEGMAEFASFDGAPQGAGATQRARQNAVGLSQIELRPEIVASTRAEDTYRQVVRYAAIKRGTASAITVAANNDLPEVLIELLPSVPTTTLPAGTQILLRHDYTGNFPKDGGTPIAANAVFPPPKAGERIDDTICYVRFIALSQGAPLDNDDALKSISGNPDNVFLVDKPPCLSGDAANEAAAAWGRFGDLPPTWLAEMLFPSKREDGSIPKPFPTTKDTLDKLSLYLRKRKDGQEAAKIPSEAPKRATLAAALGRWTRRFMELGSPSPGKALAPQLAFAVILRPDPWRIAADASGRLSVLLLEKDRYGKARKYAIRPHGRYDTLEAAVLAAKPAPKSRAEWLKLTKPGLTDDDLVLGNAPIADILASKFVDAVIERSEPLAAPVILGTRQVFVETTDSSGAFKNRHIAEVVISRHGEEVLADANITTDAGLAVRHLAVGMWREFSNMPWADAIVKEAKPKRTIELLAPFGPGHRGEIIPPPPRNEAPVFGPNGTVGIGGVRELYDRHPDLWRSAYGLRFGDLPYGFSFHVLAHVAAGAVVSPSSKATITPTAIAMRRPWEGASTAIGWIDDPLPAPSWDIDDSDKVIVCWPLVRLIDAMSPDAIETWFPDGNAPDLYRLPDSAVSYRLVVQSNDGSSQTPEIDIAAVAGNMNMKGSAYTVRSIGRRLINPKDYSIAISGGADFHYTIETAFEVPEDDAKDPSAAEFAPVIGDYGEDPRPQEVFVEPKSGPWWAIAGTAPEDGKVKALIVPPAVADPVPPPPNPPPAPQWTAFKTKMEKFVKWLDDYKTVLPQRHHAAIDRIVALLTPYVVERVRDWPGAKPNGIASPVEISVPWLLGLPANSSSLGASAAGVEILASGHRLWQWQSTPTREEFGTKPIMSIFRLLENQPFDQSLLRYLLDGTMRTLTQMRRVVEEKPIKKRAPLRRRIESGSPTRPETDTLDIVYACSVPENGDKPALYTAFDEIEDLVYPLTKPLLRVVPTLDGLRILSSIPTMPVVVMVLGSALDSIQPILAPLGSAAPKPQQLLLRKPATANRRAELVDPAWIAAARELTQEMVFGPRRKLALQCLLGKLGPVFRDVEIKP